jgi:hypothetical protein
MNVDDSRGVTADLKFGVRTSLLWWLGAGLFGAALIAAAVAAAFYSARVLRANPYSRGGSRSCDFPLSYALRRACSQLAEGMQESAHGLVRPG